MLAASVASTAGGQTRICHDLKKARTCQLCNCSSSDESPLDYVGEEIFPEASGRVPWRSYDKARAQDGGESYSAVLSLAKLWDAWPILSLEQDELEPRCNQHAAFQLLQVRNHRPHDRCSGRHHSWGFPCPSYSLALGALEIKPSCERFSVCISDRKDFYHQFKTTPQRTKTNMCFPPLLASDLEGTSALASWTFSRSKKGRPKYDRLKHGDFLDRFGLLCGKEGSSQDLFLRACFASLPQGDALGVEFAVDSHQALIQSHDIINDHTELRADRVFRGLRDAVGLVIDDFYAVPVVSTEATAGVEKSWATQKNGEGTAGLQS